MSVPCRQELREAIGRVSRAPLELLDARRHPLQSSCPLTELTLSDPGGARRRWLLKDVAHRSPRTAPKFLYDERRELAAYRALAGSGLVLAHLVGADVAADRCWLFLELVDGAPLWQSRDPADWCRAAEWLADLHALDPIGEGSPWLRYDSELYDIWMERARRFAPGAQLQELDAIHTYAIGRLADAPVVTVHGDYYPSNLLVRSPREQGACPVDFELVGVGAAALDLAALTTGLPAPFATDVIDSYRARLGAGPPREELEELLLCARLHLAIRWLGWMPSRRPPEHQRFDWAAEAHALGATLHARAAQGVLR
jgi:aminoglycoside phosphotransferase (APT) family kinase protein